MKIAYNHLNTFLKDNPSIEDVSEKLFQLGHENEIIGDILDIEFTPNRGDCLSLMGLSRDLGAFYELNKDLEIFKESINHFDLDFVNGSPKDCPNIFFLNIEISPCIKKYKPYLEKYFNDLNIKKNNFFTDISNYLAYELGQPTHCYDYSKIKDSSIEFDNIEVDEEFHTLTDQKINLNDKNCIFSADKKIINLAGVMGGITTACHKDTLNVLIESAYFNPEAIIGKSVKYDLHSEASYKFERGVDPSFQEIALRRFLKIVSDHAEIIKIQINENTNEVLENISIDYNYVRINKILGTNLSEKIISDTLSSIGFLIKDSKVVVPFHRHDIKHENDIAEEVARVIGYDKLEPKSFLIEKKSNINKEKQEYIKDFLIDNGFNEVINTPFTSLENHNSIRVDNPLDTNKNFLRTSLRRSLIKNLEFNENRQHSSIKLFEISDIYYKNKHIKNEKLLSIIVSGRVDNNYEDFSKKLDAAYLLNLFKSIKVNISPDKISIIDRIEINNKIKNKIFFIEINIADFPDEIFQYQKENNKSIFFNEYKEISEFPSSIRDISFLLSNHELVPIVEELILNKKLKNQKEVFIFDFYKKDNKNIKLGFRFIFQSIHSTLTDNDIEQEISSLISEVTSIDGISIPGL